MSENRYSTVLVQFRGYGVAEKQRFKFHVISLIRECNSDVPYNQVKSQHLQVVILSSRYVNI